LLLLRFCLSDIILFTFASFTKLFKLFHFHFYSVLLSEIWNKFIVHKRSVFFDFLPIPNRINKDWKTKRIFFYWDGTGRESIRKFLTNSLICVSHVYGSVSFAWVLAPAVHSACIVNFIDSRSDFCGLQKLRSHIQSSFGSTNYRGGLRKEWLRSRGW